MANEIQVFNNPKFGEVRTVIIDGDVWFVGKDVAQALGYVDLKHCILDHVDTEDRINSKTQGQNDPEFGQCGTWLINESGVYALIFGSKLPNAKGFKHWVTHDVLPEIRKTGSYNVTPSYLIENQVERAKAWIIEQEKLLETQKELDVAKPLAQQTQRYINNDHLIGFRELCKELNVKETDMNKLLLENNWKYRTKSGKLKYHKWVVTKGYMETKDTMNEDTGWSGTSDKFTKGRMKIEELIQNEAVE